MASSAPHSLQAFSRSVSLARGPARFDRSVRAACLIGSFMLSACDACARDPKVPFKLGGGEAGADPNAEAQLDAEARSFESATDRPTVDGKALPLDFVRALIAHDLDADGDRDVVALVHDAVVRMKLMVSMRDAQGFQEPREVAGFSAPGDASCTLQGVSLEAPVSDKAVLAITMACGDPPKTAPAYLTLLALEAPPRSVESVALPSAPEPPFALAASAQDADGDGQSDFVLKLRALAEGEGEHTLSLSLLDRASGLSRDPREPETTFAAWASAAQAQLAKQPEQGLKNAERVLRFERALCRERGEAALTFAAARGIACGKSKAVSSALATATLALAKLKDGPRALATYGELERREQKPDKRVWERVVSALATLPSEPGVSLREGPRVEPVLKPRLHLPSARFLDDNQLILRRATPVLYDLDKGSETPLGTPPDELIRDPSGQLALTAIERDGCGALHLRIEKAPKPGTPYVAGAPVSTPLIAPGASLWTCKQGVTPGHVTSGFSALGWAPQGVVLARGPEVFVVPLTVAGATAGEPFALPSETPLPAPLAGGSAAADGTRYAELSAFGVLVFERHAAPPALLRPDGFLSFAGAAVDVAISPSGRRIAVVANGTVYVLTREAR
jgi:hypothetical protein